MDDQGEALLARGRGGPVLGSAEDRAQRHSLGPKFGSTTENNRAPKVGLQLTWRDGSSLALLIVGVHCSRRKWQWQRQW